MMQTVKIITVAALAITMAACGGKKKGKGGSDEPVSLKTSKDSVSYAIGLNEGSRMLQMISTGGGDTIIDKELFLAGYSDVMRKNAKMDKAVAEQVIQRFSMRMQDKEKAKQEEQLKVFEKQHEAEKAAADKFLAENKTKPGVKETPSGLQYKEDKKGSGPKIILGDQAKVHYTLKLPDGTQLETSRGKDPYPVVVRPGQVIQGWIEALQLMSKGSKFTIYVPYDLGYGRMGQAPKIPPFAVLIFEMEVVDVAPGSAAE